MKKLALFHLGRILNVRKEELKKWTEEDIVKRVKEIADEHKRTGQDDEDERFSDLMPDHIDSDADSDTKGAYMTSFLDAEVLDDEDEEVCVLEDVVEDDDDDDDDDDDEVNGPPQQSDDPTKHQGAADADEQQERKRKLTSHIPDSPDALNNVSEEEITQLPVSNKIRYDALNNVSEETTP